MPSRCGAGNRLVVDVGEVHHLAHCAAADVLQRAAQHVEADEGPEVADVAAGVHRETARVHAHGVVARRARTAPPAASACCTGASACTGSGCIAWRMWQTSGVAGGCQSTDRPGPRDRCVARQRLGASRARMTTSSALGRRTKRTSSGCRRSRPAAIGRLGRASTHLVGDGRRPPRTCRRRRSATCDSQTAHRARASPRAGSAAVCNRELERRPELIVDLHEMSVEQSAGPGGCRRRSAPAARPRRRTAARPAAAARIRATRSRRTGRASNPSTCVSIVTGAAALERRPDADVRHRRDGARRRCRPWWRRRRGRHQLVRRSQDSRSETQFPAAPGAAHDRAVDGVVMAEQRAGLVDAALGDQPANPRAGDDEVLVADRIDLLGPEAVLRAQRAQQREVAGPLASEEKVRADPDLGDAQPVDQHRPDERLGLPLRQLVREADDGRAVDAGRSSASSFWAVVIRSGGALSGRTTRGGCGSKVRTTAVPPRSDAPRRMRSMILMCPRCRPSKLPSASTGLHPARRPRHRRESG